MPAVVFIHGLSNKPEKDYLLKLYLRKLAHEDGLDLSGDSKLSSLISYWADVLYPSADTDLAAYESAAAGDELLMEGRELSPLKIDALPPAEREFVIRMSQALAVTADDLDPAELTSADREGIRYERIPLPAWLRNRLMAKLVRDAHLYFFNKSFSPRPNETYQVRDELRKRFMDVVRSVKRENGPVVVLSHSMGTIIAYDCLMHEDSCPEIAGLITIGSPLGLDEVQDFFPKRTATNGFPVEKLKGPWINIYDPLDVVCGADPKLANDYKKNGQAAIEDIREDNWGTWRHSISKYLQGKQLRTKLGSLVGMQWP